MPLLASMLRAPGKVEKEEMGTCYFLVCEVYICISGTVAVAQCIQKYVDTYLVHRRLHAPVRDQQELGQRLPFHRQHRPRRRVHPFAAAHDLAEVRGAQPVGQEVLLEQVQLLLGEVDLVLLQQQGQDHGACVCM